MVFLPHPPHRGCPACVVCWSLGLLVSHIPAILRCSASSSQPRASGQSGTRNHSIHLTPFSGLGPKPLDSGFAGTLHRWNTRLRLYGKVQSKCFWDVAKSSNGVPGCLYQAAALPLGPPPSCLASVGASLRASVVSRARRCGMIGEL